jgi:hypothetical protein
MRGREQIIGHAVSYEADRVSLYGGPMLLLTFKMPLVSSALACVVLALATVASAPSRADPIVPYDRCAYMNHESKAYKVCVADEVAVKQGAKAAPAVAPKPKPKADSGKGL